MRREIEVFNCCENTSFLLDYLFSLLLLLTANCFTDKDLCMTKKIGTTDYADVISVLSVVKKKYKENKNAYQFT